MQGRRKRKEREREREREGWLQWVRTRESVRKVEDGISSE